MSVCSECDQGFIILSVVKRMLGSLVNNFKCAHIYYKFVQTTRTSFHFLLQTQHMLRIRLMGNGITLMTAVCPLPLKIRLW